MMDGVFGFALTVFLISLSGVLAPGPVMAWTVARGAADPHAGAWVAAGHALVELPLMALIFFGAGAALRHEPVRAVVGGLGGLALLWMGAGMLRPSLPAADGATSGRRPVAAGAVLSATNPYFLIWWATAGAALVGQSLAFGVMGFAVLASVHLSCDLGWCWILSGLSFRGGKIFGYRLQRAATALAGVALFYFAGYFLTGAGLLLAR